MHEGDEDLPAERVDGITASLTRFLEIEAAGFGVLAWQVHRSRPSRSPVS